MASRMSCRNRLRGQSGHSTAMLRRASCMQTFARRFPHIHLERFIGFTVAAQLRCSSECHFPFNSAQLGPMLCVQGAMVYCEWFPRKLRMPRSYKTLKCGHPKTTHSSESTPTSKTIAAQVRPGI